MSPDGRFLAWSVEDESIHFRDDPHNPMVIYTGSRIRLYDIAADKLVDRFPGFKGDASALTFIDGGKTLVTVDHGNPMVRLWNFETGKEERSFRAVRGEDQKSVWRTELSRDGKRLAVAYVLCRGIVVTSPIGVWDVASGKELCHFDDPSRYVQNMAFSPDGRWLVDFRIGL